MNTIFLITLSVHLVTANPGVNPSKEININWHCDKQGSTLQITSASDPSFSKAKTFVPSERIWSSPVNCDSLAKLERFVCTVELKGLRKNSSYLYRILDQDKVSESRSFTTANCRNEWKFIALADFQFWNNDKTHPMIAKLQEISGGVPFAICSGDLTDYGSNEEEWRWALDNEVWNNLVFAASPGDHEYWTPKNEQGRRPQAPRPEFYLSAFDFPKNGVSERLGSNYWYIYNNALMVSLDLGDSNTSSSELFVKEAEWLKKIAKENEGKYRWLIVYGHKSQFGSPITDSGVVKNMQPVFAPAFKEAGVDLVISGHDHKYSRTKVIDGTVYLDLGSSGTKFRKPEDEMYSDGIHEKVIDLKTEEITAGAIVSVSKQSLEVTIYDLEGNVLDSFSKQ